MTNAENLNPDTSSIYLITREDKNKTPGMMRDTITIAVNRMDLGPDCLGSDSGSTTPSSYMASQVTSTYEYLITHV